MSDALDAAFEKIMELEAEVERLRAANRQLLLETHALGEDQ